MNEMKTSVNCGFNQIEFVLCTNTGSDRVSLDEV